MFTSGNTINNTLTASGGNERTTFYMSGSYLTQSGTVVGPNDYLKRSSIRLSADHRLFDKLRVGGNITVAETNQGGVQKGFNFSSVTWTSYMTPPEFNNQPYLSPVGGTAAIVPDSRSRRTRRRCESRGFDNPFWTAATAVSTSNDPRTFGDMHAQYDPLPWLKLTYQLGVDNSNDSRLQGQGQSNSNSLSPAGQVLTLDFDHNTVNQDVVATATYARGDKLTGSLALGQQPRIAERVRNGLIGDGLADAGAVLAQQRVERAVAADDGDPPAGRGVFRAGPARPVRSGLPAGGAALRWRVDVFARQPVGAVPERERSVGVHQSDGHRRPDQLRQAPRGVRRSRHAAGAVSLRGRILADPAIHERVRWVVRLAAGNRRPDAPGDGARRSTSVRSARGKRKAGFDLGLFGRPGGPQLHAVPAPVDRRDSRHAGGRVDRLHAAVRERGRRSRTRVVSWASTSGRSPGRT